MRPRISRDRMLMEMAMTAAKRSTCQRIERGIGALIARESRVISTGYAGPPSGAPECSASICDLSRSCTRTVHAEANAIAFAARKGTAIEGATMYCTLSPCVECAKLIINSGIARVFYLDSYRLPDGILLLTGHGVEARQFVE